VTARKFKELEAAPEHVEVEAAVPIEMSIRPLQVPEFITNEAVELASAGQAARFLHV
jgi:hypothetical protein